MLSCLLRWGEICWRSELLSGHPRIKPCEVTSDEKESVSAPLYVLSGGVLRNIILATL